MNEPNDYLQSTNQNQILVKVEQILEQRIKQIATQAYQVEILKIYQDLLQVIWNKILPTLGQVTVMAIMERALVLTKEKYSLIRYLHITPQGISFEELFLRLKQEEELIIQEALKKLVVNVFDMLIMLTGDILIQQLVVELENRKTF
ncbi:hypothetical protein Sta7437_3338 [Stanieria cyanosphaera PCC 7437]|uniref:Uncharacterized protein n=1 Tax=Stanieria cyanosphaera (strain ATCC 29371 / PCC 7437) TaxID=111780 RepID=K9XXQ9_STAC7|nr:hypothetical protein [Stanieria cyanosphaera]AFZ36844.1 hypothetical protein Sta7437_3338 [Stanieria cyanosphaera PCC 7437]